MGGQYINVSSKIDVSTTNCVHSAQDVLFDSLSEYDIETQGSIKREVSLLISLDI